MGKNITSIIKRANARMNILRKLKEFKPKMNDMRVIYISYIRSVLEQSCQVWHSSITEENSNDLERVQKDALKIILQENYVCYESALHKMNLMDLKSRRELLCGKFALSCISNQKTSKMFPNRNNLKSLRKNEKFEVIYARTKRYKNTSIPYMQSLLNNLF